jgi:glycosyltransferase involved in cell wall biosynthesis
MPPDTVCAVVLTYDEAINIARCVESLTWCDDTVVVDSGSVDGTCEIARQLGARVFTHHQDGYFQIGVQRNWALSNCNISASWVLFIDADEVVTPPLAEEIRRRCAIESPFEAFQLAPKYLFHDVWMRRSAGYPNWHDRLVRSGVVTLASSGYLERFAGSPATGRLEEPYLHYGNSKGFDDWLGRHQRYATWDAQQVARFLDDKDRSAFGRDRKRRLRETASYLWPLRPAARFLYMYVVRGGFLDGPPALLFCLRHAVYEYMAVEKIIEQRRRRRGLPL